MLTEKRSQSTQWKTRMGRLAGIVFGVATQLLFLWTVVELFYFLRDGGRYAATTESLWIDCLLAIGFAVPHSLLLVPPVQQLLHRVVPPGLIGCLHCSVTCLTLLVLFSHWRVTETTAWEAKGIVRWLILGGFYASWGTLFYSLYLTGLGYQTGLTQWWYWLIRQKPPRREFVIRGLYRCMRHPVYMSFLGLIWFVPTMTIDHLILTAVWTAYIYVGSYMKDRRLLRYIGRPYLDYAALTPGLPIIGIGSLRFLRPTS